MADTIPRLVFEAAKRHAGEHAIVDEAGQRLTFDELAAAIRRAAKAFIAAGLQPGEAVGLWAPNGAHWVVAAVGAQAAGGVLVPLNTRLVGREVAEIAERAKLRLLVTRGEFLGRDYPSMLAGHSLPQLCTMIVQPPVGANGDGSRLGWDDFLAAASAVEEAALEARLDRLNGDDIADVMFTSGTTGAAKGAVFTHRQTLLAARTFSELCRITAQDRYLPFGPFSHTASYKGGWLAGLLAGATIYARNSAEPRALMELVNAERISFMPAPPTVLQAILADPLRGDFDLSSLRLVSTGGAMVPVDLLRRVKTELGVAQVATAYGLTESAGTATFTQPDDPLEIIACTAGRPAPGVAIKCVRPDGSDAAPGEQGEILIRADKVMSGYLHDPAATAATFTPDGWLRSGDLGRIDAAGNLTVTDRLKDMYIVGGFNCYPAEIERELSGYPGVLHCAVVGVPDARLGEVGRAFIVPKADSTLSEPDVLAWCKANFANYKVPRSIQFVDALPMNASGKVLKDVLRGRG